MPKYKFICNKCKIEDDKVVPVAWNTIPCNCGGALVKQLPVLKKTVTKERVDVDRKIDWIDNQEEIMKERSTEHFWKIEVPRLVQSGEYSIKHMMENGWIYKDENGKIQINTVPPNKEKDVVVTPKKKRGRPKK